MFPETMSNDAPKTHATESPTQFIPHRGDRFMVGFLVITFLLLAVMMIADMIRGLLSR